MLVLILTLLVTPFVSAQELEAPGGVWWQTKTRYVLMQAIERGIPLIGAEGDDTTWKVEGNSNSYDGIMKQAESGRTLFLTRYRESLRKTADLRKARLNPTETAATAPAVTPQPVKPVEKFSETSWKTFCACTEKALRTLKLKARVNQSESPFESAALESLLKDERGDGEKIVPTGLACGLYLGEFGITAGKRDIAILASLSKTTDAQKLNLLWRYFVLLGKAEKAKSQLEIPLFWNYAWKRVSFYSLVTNSEIPSPAKLVRSFTSNDGKLSVPISGSQDKILDALKRDWNSVVPVQLTTCERI